MPNTEPKNVDPVYRYVGNRLRHFRRERGLKQAALAEVIGVSPQQYQKYEDAQSKCSLTNLFKLAEHLGVDIHSIMPIGVDSYGEPSDRMPDRAVNDIAAGAGSGHHAAAEGDMIARLVSSFLLINDIEAREHLVRFIERMAANVARPD